jgi:RHS repeat-associated protein
MLGDGQLTMRAKVILAIVGYALLGLAATVSLAGGSSRPESRTVHAAVEPIPAGQEIVGRRTATSRTYADDHGFLRTRVYPGPVNYRDAAGHWQPIDDTLVADASGGVRNKANSYRDSLPADLSNSVAFSAAGREVDFGVIGARGPGSPHGNNDHYADVLPGVSVDYTAENVGLKESLTLADASAQSSFRYRLNAGAGLTPQTNRNGGIDLVDGDGNVQFSFTAPYVRDRSGATQPLNLGLDNSGPSPVITMSVDKAWLADPARQFPVVVDPAIYHPENKGDTRLRYSGANQDCYITNGSSANTNFCGGTSLSLGWDGSKASRMLLQFNVQQTLPTNTVIEDAIFGIHQTGATGSGSASVGIYQLTHSWTSGATWNKYDGTSAWMSAGGDFNSTAVSTQTVFQSSDNWYAWDAKSLAQAWINNGTANNGLIVKETSEGSVNNVFTFDSTQSTNQNAPYPYFDVIYAPQSGQPGYYTYASQQLSDRMSAGVNVASGDLMIANGDLSIPGTAGMGETVSHYFNGQWERSNQDLGTGWTTNLGPDVQLRFEPDGTAVFDGASGFELPFAPNASNIYTSPAGIDAILCKSGATGCSPGSGATYRLVYNHSQHKYDFDSTGRLLDEQDQNGNTITYSYTNGQLSSISDTQGRSTTVTNTNGLITKIADSTGRNVQYSYTNGDLTTYTDANGKTTQYAYGGGGGDSDDVSQITDPSGNISQITYDGSVMSKVTSIKRITNPSTMAGYTWSFSYQSPGSECSGVTAFGETIVTDPNSHATKYCYDSQGKVTKTLDGNGNPVSAQYNTSTSDPTSVTTAMSHVSNLTWDTAADSNGNTTHNPQSAVAPAAGTTNGATDSWSGYGTSGVAKYEPTSYTDPLGTQTTLGYDSAGNLNSLTNTASQMSANFNSNGTVAWTKDGNGNQTNYGYDSGNKNLIQVQEPGGTCPPSTRKLCWTLSYDSLSRVTSVIDGNGNTTTYTIDPMDRVTKITYQDNSMIQYTYDNDGNVTQRVDNTGTATYTFDALNRATREVYPGDGGTYSYTYDGPGNLTSFTSPQGTTNYGYDAADRLTSLSEPTGSCPNGPLCTTFSYNTDDQRTQTAYPNGVTQTMTYDAADRLTEIKATNSSGTLTDNKYDWTGSNCPSTTIDHDVRCDWTDAVASKTTKYTYDVLGRLTDANTNSGADHYTYTYDSAGNLNNQVHNGTTTSYGYAPSNELCWKISGTQPNQNCSPAPNGATTFTFDANGNQTGSSDGRRFAYNNRNQTTDLTPAGGYDRQATYAGPNQQEMTSLDGIDFGYDQLGMALRKNTFNNTTMYYTREPNGNLINEGQGIDYYIYDGTGRVVMLTDHNGNMADTYTYDPQGSLLSDTQGTNWDFNPWDARGGFGYRNAGLNLYKTGLRWQDPTLANWSQQDTINNPFNLRGNRYIYAADDPINVADPTGQYVTPDPCHPFARVVTACKRANVYCKFEPNGVAGLTDPVLVCSKHPIHDSKKIDLSCLSGRKPDEIISDLPGIFGEIALFVGAKSIDCALRNAH